MIASASTPDNAPGPGLNGASRTAGDLGLVESAPVTPDSHSLVNDRTAGVDTWRLGFKVGRRPPNVRFKLGDYHGQWHPQHSLVTLEGHPYPHGLCPPELLEGAHEQVREALEDVCGAAEPTGVLRLDSTAEVRLGGSDGLAALRGMASVVPNVPGLKPSVFGKPVETVYVHSNRSTGSKLGRGYDPFFRGFTERGAAVRFEAQDRRLELDYGLNALTPRERFHRRFGPLWRASQNVSVVGFPQLSARLAVLVGGGELTPLQAERLGGFVLLQAVGVDRVMPQPTTWRRRRALLEVGLALADDSLFEPVEVKLGSVFEAALDSPEWAV